MKVIALQAQSELFAIPWMEKGDVLLKFVSWCSQGGSNDWTSL